MAKFKLVNIFDEKKIEKYNNSCFWKQCDLIPYFREGYVCFSYNEDYSFEELTRIFLQGNDDEQIGAISSIAEKYPTELYRLICDQKDYFSPKKLNFVFNFVVPSYLPLALPKERLIDYEFNKQFSTDIWVKILVKIRSLL